jgi:hypothetical protein
MYLDSHQLTPVGSHPPVATSPRAHEPLIPDREALRASAHSLGSLLLSSHPFLTALAGPRARPPLSSGRHPKCNMESQAAAHKER